MKVTENVTRRAEMGSLIDEILNNSSMNPTELQNKLDSLKTITLKGLHEIAWTISQLQCGERFDALKRFGDIFIECCNCHKPGNNTPFHESVLREIEDQLKTSQLKDMEIMSILLRHFSEIKCMKLLADLYKDLSVAIDHLISNKISKEDIAHEIAYQLPIDEETLRAIDINDMISEYFANWNDDLSHPLKKLFEYYKLGARLHNTKPTFTSMDIENIQNVLSKVMGRKFTLIKVAKTFFDLYPEQKWNQKLLPNKLTYSDMEILISNFSIEESIDCLHTLKVPLTRIVDMLSPKFPSGEIYTSLMKIGYNENEILELL